MLHGNRSNRALGTIYQHLCLVRATRKCSVGQAKAYHISAFAGTGLVGITYKMLVTLDFLDIKHLCIFTRHVLGISVQQSGHITVTRS